MRYAVVLLHDPDRFVMLKRPLLRTAISTFPMTFIIPRHWRRRREAGDDSSSLTGLSSSSKIDSRVGATGELSANGAVQPQSVVQEGEAAAGALV